MNVLMLSLMYPQDQMDEVSRNAKDKLQNQINNYQRAFVEGIESNLLPDEKLDIFNCLPVGIYPLQYKQLFLKHGVHDSGRIYQSGCINFPFLKQYGRFFSAVRYIEKWLRKDPSNRTVLVYTQYLPYMRALSLLKKRYKDLKAAVIVTDLPNELGLSSGRTGMLRKIEYRMGSQSLDLLRQMDGFILLTEPMADALQVREKPFTVIEGLILSNKQASDTEQESQHIFLYSGTLERDLGIVEMLDAFSEMSTVDLRAW